MAQAPIQKLRHLLDEIRAENARELDPIAITRLRTRFNELMAQIADAVEVHDEFEERFAKMRGVTNLHQLKWGTCRLLDDPKGYREDSQHIGRSVRDFLDWFERITLAEDHEQDR